MSANERISVDIQRYHILEEPGLKPPGQRLTYASPSVQDIVGQIFGDLLPNILYDDEGRPYYEMLDESGKDVCVRSRSVSSIEDIPPEELLALEVALEYLHGLVSEPTIAIEVRRILADFQLPDPETNLDRYRLYENEQGEKRLLVLWGFRGTRNAGLPMLATAALSILKTRVDTATVREAAIRQAQLIEMARSGGHFPDGGSDSARDSSLASAAHKMWERFSSVTHKFFGPRK